MAFCGHVDLEGRFVEDEVFNGSTVINRRNYSPQMMDVIDDDDDNEDDDTESIWSSRTFVKDNENDLLTVRSKHLQKDKRSSSDQSLTSSDHLEGRQSISWSDLYAGIKGSDIPSLDLASNSPTPTYLRDMSDIKLNREPSAAFENWFSAKRKLRQQREEQAKAERERQKQMEEERKMIAKQCYEQWCRGKARLAVAQRESEQVTMATLKSQCNFLRGPKKVRDVPQDIIEKVVEDWWLKKAQAQARLRQAERKAEQKKTEQQQRRKQLAQESFDKWLQNACGKPKPVPLNRGIDSLRGTISELYINPQPWVTPKEPQSEN